MDIPPFSILVPPREGPGEYFQPPGLMGLDDAYEYIRVSEGIQSDPYASELLWAGFFDPNATPDQRHAARTQYFNYMGYDEQGDMFDWAEWRDWYNEYYGIPTSA